MSNCMKIRRAVLELLHEDRQTDMVKLIGTFLQDFHCEHAKNGLFIGFVFFFFVFV
jgi:hypothetical protein